MTNILFICIDSLRSDFATMKYGSDKPFFPRFMEEGTVFTDMIATATTTSPCVASFMTGYYPFTNGVNSLTDSKLNPDIPTLASVFKENGYTTYADVVGPFIEGSGIGKGFDTFNIRETDETLYTEWYENFKETLQNLEGPWFSYLHLWELHWPQDLPSDRKPGEMKYDAALRGIAAKMEELFDVVDLEDTVIVLHGDHGEAIPDPTLLKQGCRLFMKGLTFLGWNKVYDHILRDSGIPTEQWRHALWRLQYQEFPDALFKEGHGYHVYDFIAKVPLMLIGADVSCKIETEQVRQVDIFPTLLALADITPPKTDGQNILGNFEHRPAYIRGCGSALRTQQNWLEGVRYKGWKYIEGRNGALEQLFHVEKDSKERVNLRDHYKKISRTLRQELKDIRTLNHLSARYTAEEEEAVKERLEHLGYL